MIPKSPRGKLNSRGLKRSLAAANGSMVKGDAWLRNDEPIADALVIALSVTVRDELAEWPAAWRMNLPRIVQKCAGENACKYRRSIACRDQGTRLCPTTFYLNHLQGAPLVNRGS